MHKLRLSLQSANQKEKLHEKYYVGCSGWFYWHWKGKVYLENLKTNEWFGLYQNKFSR